MRLVSYSRCGFLGIVSDSPILIRQLAKDRDEELIADLIGNFNQLAASFISQLFTEDMPVSYK